VSDLLSQHENELHLIDNTEELKVGDEEPTADHSSEYVRGEDEYVRMEEPLVSDYAE